MDFTPVIPSRYACSVLRSSASAALAFAAALPMVSQARAQHSQYNIPSGLPAAEVAKLEADRRLIYRHMLNRPGDQQAAFAYAILSGRLGDLEGAASTYEAMLLRSPDAGRVRAELGAIYFRLQAMEAARGHFRILHSRDDTPAPVRGRVEGYLAAIDAWQRERQGFSGSVTFGLHSQSNASSVTDNPYVTLNGQVWTLQSSALGKGDVSAFASANLRYRHPLGHGAHRLLGEVTLGVAEYNDLKQLNSRSFELRAGPDFSLAAIGLPAARISFSALSAVVSQGGERALTAWGLGSTLRMTPAPGRQLSLDIDWREDDYRLSTANPRANLWDSGRLRLSFAYSQELSPRWTAFGQAGFENRHARDAMNGYRDLSLRLGLGHRHKPLLGSGSTPWTLGVSASVSRRSFKGADPMINARAAQRSTDRQLQLVETVPLGARLNLQVYGGLRKLRSNYDIRSFRDRFAGLTLTRRF